MQKTLPILLSILAITAAVFAAGCIGINTTLHPQSHSSASPTSSSTTNGRVFIITPPNTTSTDSTSTSTITGTSISTSTSTTTTTTTTSTNTNTSFSNTTSISTTNHSTTSTLLNTKSTRTTVSGTTIGYVPLPTLVAGGTSNVILKGTYYNLSYVTLIMLLNHETGYFGWNATNYSAQITMNAIVIHITNSPTPTRITDFYTAYTTVTSQYGVGSLVATIISNHKAQTFYETTKIVTPNIILFHIPSPRTFTVNTKDKYVLFSVSGMVPHYLRSNETTMINGKETVNGSGTYYYSKSLLIFTGTTLFYGLIETTECTVTFTIKIDPRLGPVEFTHFPITITKQSQTNRTSTTTNTNTKHTSTTTVTSTNETTTSSTPVTTTTTLTKTVTISSSTGASTNTVVLQYADVPTPRIISQGTTVSITLPQSWTSVGNDIMYLFRFLNTSYLSVFKSAVSESLNITTPPTFATPQYVTHIQTVMFLSFNYDTLRSETINAENTSYLPLQLLSKHSGICGDFAQFYAALYLAYSKPVTYYVMWFNSGGGHAFVAYSNIVNEDNIAVENLTYVLDDWYSQSGPYALYSFVVSPAGTSYTLYGYGSTSVTTGLPVPIPIVPYDASTLTFSATGVLVISSLSLSLEETGWKNGNEAYFSSVLINTEEEYSDVMVVSLSNSLLYITSDTLITSTIIDPQEWKLYILPDWIVQFPPITFSGSTVTNIVYDLFNSFYPIVYYETRGADGLISVTASENISGTPFTLFLTGTYSVGP